MNQDFIIGRGNPHILFAEYTGDASNLAPDTGGVSEAKSASAAKSAVGAPDAQELSFKDVLDIINPLQHIPIISTIYRAVTGDTISGFAGIVGGALFGGPLGLIGGAIEAAFNDETGHSPAETLVSEALGIKDHATLVAEADRTPRHSVTEEDTFETQIASAPAENVPARLDTQLAAAMPKPQTLDAQLAMGAALPPVGPSPVKGKQPYGGMMDMAMVEKARAGAPHAAKDAAPFHVAEADEDEAEPLAAALPAASGAHPQDVAEDQKFYPLAKVKHFGGGMPVAMPSYSGPDVRLKPVSRMAINSKSAAPQSVRISIPDQEAEARKVLGLSNPTAPLADNAASAAAILTPDQADLAPAYGNASQAVPSALIEDMMKSGLDKYQRGISNGTLSAPPGIDVRG